VFDKTAFLNGVLGFFGAFLICATVYGAGSFIHSDIYNKGFNAGYLCGFVKQQHISNENKYYTCKELAR